MPKLRNRPGTILGVIILFGTIFGIVLDYLAKFSGAWSLFNSTPFFQWIQKKGISTQLFVLYLIWTIAILIWGIWVLRRNAKPVKIEIDAERHSETTRGTAGDVFNYYCRIIVKNIVQSDFEGLEVKLSEWTPNPSNQSGFSGASESPLPTTFPVVLAAKSGGTIQETKFQLFKMVRDGNVPTIEITGKERMFRSFQPQSKWCSIEIQVSANGKILGTQKFEVRFEPDLQGIPAFEIKKKQCKIIS